MKKWGVDRVAGDARWRYGTPPDGNANYAWIQHFIHHLAPDGRAGFVLANGSLTVGGVEGEIRKRIVQDDLVDCVVALPAQLFFTTGIPVCLWFLDRNKAASTARDRRGETLFLDARSMGRSISRTQIELTAEDIARISDAYKAWKDTTGRAFSAEEGFSASVIADVIEEKGWVLSPGRFIAAPARLAQKEDVDQRPTALRRELGAEFENNERLKREVCNHLRGLGHEI